MARSNIQVIDAPVRAGIADLNFVDLDTANDNQCDLVDDLVLIIWNKHGANAATLTISSVADRHERTEDIVQVLAAGEYFAFGPYQPNIEGWAQQGNALFFEQSAGTGTLAAAPIKAGGA